MPEAQAAPTVSVPADRTIPVPSARNETFQARVLNWHALRDMRKTAPLVAQPVSTTQNEANIIDMQGVRPLDGPSQVAADTRWRSKLCQALFGAFWASRCEGA